ncbi:hypothetical protein POX_e06384 [Penicillium oxalicum]|uniref:hypothetical protein n=1 Tax=Penicillium oxalicum TaxID=69781 RepID=UPI0020B81547|nr:hypothetical protein POX_e06384 [Penicillium oxalicum]KAI2788369.1 hypothetical protein POX_e06384 [Penicillium oxalicum]
MFPVSQSKHVPDPQPTNMLDSILPLLVFQLPEPGPRITLSWTISVGRHDQL